MNPICRNDEYVGWVEAQPIPISLHDGYRYAQPILRLYSVSSSLCGEVL